MPEFFSPQGTPISFGNQEPAIRAKDVFLARAENHRRIGQAFSETQIRKS
jgi:hypothetical protein